MKKEYKLLDVKELSLKIRKTVRTIQVDVTRRPETLPPRLIIPGGRKLLWLDTDVDKWLEKCRQY